MKPYRCKTIKEYRALQFAVAVRDNFRCVECHRYLRDIDGCFPPPHHIKFKSQGGKDKTENMELLCLKCHDKKHGRQ